MAFHYLISNSLHTERTQHTDTLGGLGHWSMYDISTACLALGDVGLSFATHIPLLTWGAFLLGRPGYRPMGCPLHISLSGCLSPPTPLPLLARHCFPGSVVKGSATGSTAANWPASWPWRKLPTLGSLSSLHSEKVVLEATFLAL